MTQHLHILPRTVRGTLLALAALGIGYLAPPALGLTKPAQAAVPNAGKLGDLSPFRSIVVDVTALVEKGDLPSAKKRIKDLETQWDAAEAGLKPRAAAEWHKVDKAIDRALSAVRADAPKVDVCKQSLVDVLQTMDRVGTGP